MHAKIPEEFFYGSACNCFSIKDENYANYLETFEVRFPGYVWSFLTHPVEAKSRAIKIWTNDSTVKNLINIFVDAPMVFISPRSRKTIKRFYRSWGSCKSTCKFYSSVEKPRILNLTFYIDVFHSAHIIFALACKCWIWSYLFEGSINMRT